MEIKPYGKGQLAHAYFPYTTVNAGLNRLAAWIRYNPALAQALADTGYRPTQRIFTSRQVALLFHYLGEP